MERIPEPELMADEAQARAYAQADFSAAHEQYPRLFAEAFPGLPDTALVLDLGCGPGDVTFRFARVFPGYRFHAVDGSAAMLRCATAVLDHDPALAARVRLIEGFIPDVALPETHYDVILSTSFLHHLHEPQVLWQTIRRHGRAGTRVFVADLFRPADRAAADRLVATYSLPEPAVLRRDFLNSLLAAFTPEEIRAQLHAAGLARLEVRLISDRHLTVHGTL